MDVKLGNIVPSDWIYSPILIVYSDQQKNKAELPEDQQIHIIKNCLRWIYIYETHFPELAALINTTDRFCRLSCVFLGSDSLFLNAEIHKLLEMCLRIVIDKYESELNFDQPVNGMYFKKVYFDVCDCFVQWWRCYH